MKVSNYALNIKDYINYVQVTTSYMKQISSYVMQDDQLFPMLTVLETLRFAAEVRLPPSLSRAEKLKRVWELIEQLGLQVKSRLPCVLGYYIILQKD
jgi:ABC-type multidrug transport system ATPase subunit